MVVYIIYGARTVASVLYLGIGSGTMALCVLGQNIALAAPIWRIRHWFLVVVARSHSVGVVVMDVGMLGVYLLWLWI